MFYAAPTSLVRAVFFGDTVAAYFSREEHTDSRILNLLVILLVFYGAHVSNLQVEAYSVLAYILSS